MRSAFRRQAEDGPGTGDGGATAAHVVAHISELFLRVGFTAAADQALRLTGEALNGDSAYLLLASSYGVHTPTPKPWIRHGDDGAVTRRQVSAADLPELTTFSPSADCVQLDAGIEANVEATEDAGQRSTRGISKVIAAPMSVDDQAFGWLVVERCGEEHRWSEAECSILCRLAGLMAVAHARQQHWDELQRLALAVEQSPATVIITDPDGVIEYVNPRFTTTSGYGYAEAIGKVFRMPEDENVAPEAYRQLRQAMAAGEPWRGELPNRRKDGSSYWEAVSVSPIRSASGRISHIIAVKEDISEQRRFHEQLQRAKDDAELANRAKSEFLANMSHEIRTPVNAILGNTHLTLQTELSDRQRDHLRKIRAASQSLLGIINSILDFSTIDAGRMSIDAFDFRLEDVLDNLRDLLEAKARAKGLRLRFSVDDRVPGALVGDPFRLGQVLINLGDNAVKFTSAGDVEVVVSLKEQSPEHVRLSFAVRDTGVGIAEEHLAAIFQPFTQGDASTTRPFGGTGLGLAVAHRLVEMMGGELAVSSEPGRGSSFAFSLSFRRQSLPRSPRVAPSRELSGMRVLVVDDSMTSRSVLSEALESFSFQPEAVESGEAALELLVEAERAGAPFRVVLMDWKMPTMDGLEASRRIKNHSQLTAAPAVILITGYGREDIMQQVDKSMLDGFLLKPVNPSLLFDAILVAIGHASSPELAVIEAAPEEAVETGSGGRVLVVEDNLLNQEVARELLADMGLHIAIADNGRDALEILHREPFDLILMDVQMPVMDGYAATAEIRSVPELAHIPIVAMTAHAMSGDRERCLGAGMNDYISKPIDLERLREILGEWLPQVEAAAGDAAVVRNGEPEPALPLSLPGLNMEAGLARIGGNRRLYHKLLRHFLHDYRSVPGTIGTALHLGHLESGLRLLHTLKGVAATIGAEGVHVAARELEIGVAAGDRDRTSQLLRQLERSLMPVLAGIAGLEETGKRPPLAAASNAASGALDLRVAAPLVCQLDALLREGDPDASEAFDALQAVVGHHAALITVLDELGEQVESFDFDDALLTLDALSDAIGLRAGDRSDV